MTRPGDAPDAPSAPESVPPAPDGTPPAPGRVRAGLRGSARTRRLLRELHARTGELELLISGAVAVLLFLVPGRIDAFYYRISAQLSGAAEFATFFGFYYLKLILYVLILTFGLHLIVRAFWVSLVGLDSVFPRGIAWSRLTNGPATIRVFRRILPSTRELIVYADGVASVTFAAGFSLVAIFLVSVVFAGAFSATVTGVMILLPGVEPNTTAVTCSAVVVAVGLTFPMFMDRVFGRLLVGDGWRSSAGRILETIVAGTLRISGFQAYGPIQLTLSSRVGRTRFGFGAGVVMVLVLGFFIVWDGLLQSGVGRVGFDPFQPVRVGEAGVNPRHYEDRPNPEGRLLLIPTIQTEVFTEEDPFLRIFVPTDPERDVAALSRACPGLEPLSATGFRRARRRASAPADSLRAAISESLACHAALWTIRVDGIAVSQPPLFYEQSETGLDGIAWFVDLRPLEPGRHVVEVARVEGVDDDGEIPVSDWTWRIPFWN